MADDLAVLCLDTAEAALDRTLLSSVTARLGISPAVPINLEGLKAVYASWCRHIPFDNIRKLINLRKPGSLMPGMDPNDFFENWLANGTGGTCWPSSNALYSLLTSLGFAARRVAGSMFDMPMINHGTVKVRIDGEDWMVDTSMLTGIPLPMHRGVYIHDGEGTKVEVEPIDDSHIVWIDFVPLPTLVPCRLHRDPVETPFYRERYEIFSRENGPFNARLYFRKRGPEGPSVLLGNVRFARTETGLDVREFTPDELYTHLKTEAGVSETLLDEWTDLGCLAASFDPSTQGPVPEITGLPPSLR